MAKKLFHLNPPLETDILGWYYNILGLKCIYIFNWEEKTFFFNLIFITKYRNIIPKGHEQGSQIHHWVAQTQPILTNHMKLQILASYHNLRIG